MNRPLRAIAGGVVGTAVLSMLLLLLEVETRNALVVFEAVARFVGVPGRRGVGFVLFVLAGSVAWPLLFAALHTWLGEGDAVPRGMAFAALLWVVFVIVGGSGIEGAVLIIFAGFTLLAHLAYGFTLAVVYQGFEGVEVVA